MKYVGAIKEIMIAQYADTHTENQTSLQTNK